MRLWHEGFEARVKLGDDDQLVANVSDTHEPIQICERTVSELRSDFATKISAYKTRCTQRGIEPFDTFEGKSRSDEEADYLVSLSEPGNPPGWPHRHQKFFEEKAWNIAQSARALENLTSTSIPNKLRLPIDDVTTELRSRKRSPHIHSHWKTAEGERQLNWFIRIRLEDGFRAVSLADPRNREQRREFNLQFLQEAQHLQSVATDFTKKYHSPTMTFPTFSRGADKDTASIHFETVLEAESHLLQLLARLSEIISWGLRRSR